jgi:hypothetical protein
MEDERVNASPATTGEPARRRIPRLLIKFLAVYSTVIVSFIAILVLGAGKPRERAIILMALGLIFLWVVCGGALTIRYRDRIRAAASRLPIGWQGRFFLMATGLAMLEEAITTTMSNLAPVFGSQIGVAYITASTNYFIVIAFSSVVVFVPEFAAWTYLLRRWSFTPNEVFLLYGFLGTTMEASLNPGAMYAGFWFFIYGLMVYLPAYSLPADRGAQSPRLKHYVLAYFLPLACAIPVAVADILLGRALGIHLWS